MMKILILLVLHTVLAFEYHHRHEKVYYHEADAYFHFQQFMEKYNKTYYDGLEKAVKFNIFRENLVKINEQNRRDPHCSFAINQFTDLTTEEFLHKHTGLRPDLADVTSSCRVQHNSALNFVDAPQAFDWRDHIDIKVKDQKRCGSCWAFAATGNIEAQFAIKYKRSISLSEQQLVDCNTDDYGCNGGFSTNAFRYLIQSGGQELDDDYPYVGEKQSCQFSPGQARVRLTDCITFQVYNEDMIKELLFKYGPLTAEVDAYSLHIYNGGVLSNCVFNKLGHAVLIVGYGTDYENKDFWVIKNSWGSMWGEDGFARIRRGVYDCGLQKSRIATSVIL